MQGFRTAVEILAHENVLTVKGQIKEPEQGVEYLRGTVGRRFFPDLWDVRLAL